MRPVPPVQHSFLFSQCSFSDSTPTFFSRNLCLQCSLQVTLTRCSPFPDYPPPLLPLSENIFCFPYFFPPSSPSPPPQNQIFLVDPLFSPPIPTRETSFFYKMRYGSPLTVACLPTFHSTPCGFYFVPCHDQPRIYTPPTQPPTTHTTIVHLQDVQLFSLSFDRWFPQKNPFVNFPAIDLVPSNPCLLHRYVFDNP